jgi:hypothetical protein
MFPLDDFPHRPALAEELGPPDFGHRFVGQLHDMEFVVDNVTQRGVAFDAQTKRFKHIPASGFDLLALWGAEHFEETIEGFPAAAHTEPQGFPGREIAHHGDKLLLRT